MKQPLLLALIFLLLPFVTLAQTVITGHVMNKAGEALIVTVMVQSKGSVTIAGYASTTATGDYSVTYKGTADSITITVSGINIGKSSKTVANRSGKVNFVIDEKPLDIKEVAVVAPKITARGDTINYLVASYIDQNDRVIGDVLKKLPGIEVKPSGSIQYQGRDINKFYIENLDLLQGRYSLATKNIAARDIATVQIMENHQPIKALKDKILSDQAAINLKVKESAKNTWSLTGLAGAGYQPVMWNAEMAAMFFEKTKQNMTAYKSNNSGDDVSGEFRTHLDYERVYMNQGSSLAIQSPATPPVLSKRYLYNRSHAATVNQLFKTGKETELTANILYYSDRIEKEGYSYYEQYLPGDSVLAIEERVTSISKIHNAEVSLRMNTNTSGYYLSNAFNITGNWNNDYGSGVTRSTTAHLDETIVQQLDKPALTVDNTMNIIKNINNNTYNMYFSVGYGRKPHHLTVSPVAYFGDDHLSSLTQQLLSEDFATVIRTTYFYRVKKFQLSYALWGRADVKNMETELLGKDMNDRITAPVDSMKNNLGYNTYQAGINQEYTYATGSLRTVVRLPLTYYRLSIDDRIPDKATGHTKIIANPSLSIRYDVTPVFIINAGTNFNRSFGDINSTYTGYIMQNYRSLLRNSVDRLFETQSGGGNVSFSYRNVFKSFFINGGANYNRSRRNMLYGYTYQGIMSVKTVIDQPTQSDGIGANINGSKGLNFWSATVRASGGYNTGTGEMLIQDEKLKTRSQGYNANGSFTITPVTFVGLVYSLSYSQGKSYTVERPERFPAIRHTSQELKFNIFPIKALTFNFSFEHQHNSAANPRTTYFADAGVKFKHKQWDLELAMNNLFNAKQYVSASYSDISTYFYSYDLRPVNVLLKARFKIK